MKTKGIEPRPIKKLTGEYGYADLLHPTRAFPPSA